MFFFVKNIDTAVVGTDPDQAAVVFHNSLDNVGIQPGTSVFITYFFKSVCFGIKIKNTLIGPQHIQPEVAVTVDGAIVEQLLAFITVFQECVSGNQLPAIRTQPVQRPVFMDYPHHSPPIFLYRRNLVVFGLVAFCKNDAGSLFGNRFVSRLIEIQALCIMHKPVIPLFIPDNIGYGSVRQCKSLYVIDRIADEIFLLRVVYGGPFDGRHPYFSIRVLEKFDDVIIEQRSRIAHVIQKNPHIPAVVAVEPRDRPKPHKAAAVFQKTGYLVVGQPIVRVQLHEPVLGRLGRDRQQSRHDHEEKQEGSRWYGGGALVHFGKIGNFFNDE